MILRRAGIGGIGSARLSHYDAVIGTLTLSLSSGLFSIFDPHFGGARSALYDSPLSHPSCKVRSLC